MAIRTSQLNDLLCEECSASLVEPFQQQSPFTDFSSLLLPSPPDRRSIAQHRGMLADALRSVDNIIACLDEQPLGRGFEDSQSRSQDATLCCGCDNVLEDRLHATIETPSIGLSQALDLLLKKRENLTQLMNGHDSLLSPERRLPLELLAEVFLEYAALLQAGVSTIWIEVPVTLGLVCRRWRNMTLALPQLWTHIKVDLEREEGLSPSLVSQIWIPRSGHLPLALDVNVCDRTDHAYVAPILGALIQLSSRWEHASLCVPPDGLRQIASIHSQLPFLQTLRIVARDRKRIVALNGQRIVARNGRKEHVRSLWSRDWQESGHRWHAFRMAPRLRDVQIHNVPLMLLGLPLTQLDKVGLDDFYLDELASVLDQCPSLEHCRLFDIRMRWPASMTSGPITEHRNITILDINGKGDDINRCNLSVILGAVTLPGLRCLTIERIFWRQDAFVAFIERSQCPLRSLKLHDTDIGEDELIRCLEAFPLLEELDVRVSIRKCTYRRLFAYLASAPTCGLPNLRSFSLYNPAKDCIVYETGLTTFVESRLPVLSQGQIDGGASTPAPLEKIRLGLWRPLSEACQLAATNYRDRGLAIDVFCLQNGESERAEGTNEWEASVVTFRSIEDPLHKHIALANKNKIGHDQQRRVTKSLRARRRGVNGSEQQDRA